jgi:hypothetical protein
MRVNFTVMDWLQNPVAEINLASRARWLQSMNYSRLVRPKFKQLLATAADDARWWFLLTYLHGVMLQQSMNYSLLARPKFKQARSYGYWRFRDADPFEPIYTVQRLRMCTRTPFSAPLLTQVILFYRFYEAILDSCRKNLVALGGESCSSCRQPGRGSRVAIHNLHCNEYDVQ